MKNYEIRIQPFSALAGACLLALCFIATGAFAPQGSASARDVSATEIVGTFNPRTAVRITDTAAYTVPLGKILVVTAMGNGVRYSDYSKMYVDGVSWYVSSNYVEISEHNSG
ncbi:MAG: hypothetical protein MK291_13130, partial [Planctomycetes bacterium]|nr:hypothetical protein [Planctomycetota bacterium]